MPKSKKEVFTEFCQKLISLSTPLIESMSQYYDPSSSGSPDILFTRFHRFTVQKSNRHNCEMTSPTGKKNMSHDMSKPTK